MTAAVSPMERDSADILIIGAGPAGLFTVFQAGMLGMTCIVADALEAAGGQCAALYPQKPIYDIPGFPALNAEELVDRLMQQAAPFKPRYLLGARAETLTELPESEGGGFEVGFEGGRTVHARAVVVAAGGGAFVPNRPPLEQLAAYEGKSVFYSVPDKAAFRGKRVVIAGGGDSAADWAVELSGIAAAVEVVHRRDKFRCAPESERKLRELALAGALKMRVPYQPAAMEGDLASGVLHAMVLQHVETEERIRLEADVFLAFYGLAFDPGPLASWGLRFEKKHIAADPATMNAGRPGVFAAGDVAVYPGKLKFILTGFAEAALAAHSARAFLNPGKQFHFAYSTSSGVPNI